MAAVHFLRFDAELNRPNICVYDLFGYPGKIHTPMEFKGELASYEMRLR